MRSIRIDKRYLPQSIRRHRADGRPRTRWIGTSKLDLVGDTWNACEFNKNAAIREEGSPDEIQRYRIAGENRDVNGSRRALSRVIADGIGTAVRAWGVSLRKEGH